MNFPKSKWGMTKVFWRTLSENQKMHLKNYFRNSKIIFWKRFFKR